MVTIYSTLKDYGMSIPFLPFIIIKCYLTSGDQVENCSVDSCRYYNQHEGVRYDIPFFW
jgi:hypothetical protein